MATQDDRWGEVAALFDELVELDPAARAARLSALLATDPELAREVEALLQADAEVGADALFDSGAAGALPGLLEREATAPADGLAGAYRLLREIGEGGMGMVWLAERTDGAYEQQVAVKLLKRGMDTHAILRRFLQERRILARLHHPHIVRLLDGGMSADGRPFYVMEHVDGEPITEYAAHHRLDIAARVDLLAQVADAVAYAHSQLVVHRDLKPSNVLVDATGQPRVLDFGIAKLIEESGEQTVTGTGLRVLSPAYAAPEQILGEPVGTPTDVYALGLLLCELLVGVLPHQRIAHPTRLAVDAGEEAARASTLAARMSTERTRELYGESLDPARLSRRLSGDLDLIIATALKREPARRYATAAAFARDLRHWLDGRPISARADSGWYRLRRFASRHRLGVAAGVLVALSLLGGLGTAMWQARIAREQAQRADAARAQAEQQLARNERVKQFILALFGEQDPVARARAKARSPVELIRAGIDEIEASLADEPGLQAELLRDLGEIQANLDESDVARATLQRAWDRQKAVSGEDSVASAEAQAAYGEAVYRAGDAVAAAPLLRDAIARLQAAGLGQRPRAAQAESALSQIELIGARNDEAERLARHALESDRANYGRDSLQVSLRLSSLGKVLQETGRYDEALATYREALAIVRARGGDDHARAAILHTYIADVLRVQRRYAEALPEYEAAVRIERELLPPGHAILGATLLRLGDLQRRMRRLGEADRTLSEAIAMLERTRSGQYAQALQFHAGLARAQGAFDLAAQRYQASFEVFREASGDSIYAWLTALARIESLVDAGQLEVADAEAGTASAALARLPEDAYAKLYEANVLGVLRHAQGRTGEAIVLRRRGLDGLLEMYGPEHAEVPQARIALAASLAADGGADARREAHALLDEARAVLGRSSDQDAAALVGHANLVRSQLRFAEGDVAAARVELEQALRALQGRPEDARHLREAHRFARRLGMPHA